jgi:hypothetical protein
MPKAHIHNGALTLPLTEELRATLEVHEGEELDAHVFKGGVTFTRTTDEARREAGQRLLALVDQVRVRPGQPEMSPEAVDNMIDTEGRAVRRARRNRPRHD